ncbi:TIGR03085 family metal-binding protein [Blastococcus sp. CT_GayMR16]|uniref:TIGR03085 family metal-binding protein n=1 Tax=Blastococcus sp. CT_GayMR16 TaxID=2559607 RepID=UPI0010739AC8|nr:TIGR03085 family metal-binding protein [Blastococcus sp. CT_GayMR16]TFV87573.1 TIGR03085 family protein [Blastococcus sp. CT_GayMR16]
MTSSSPPFADQERRELADLLAKVGPDAPTLCAGWDTAHLVAHLVVRERRPDALVGLGVEVVGAGGPLATWPHRLEDKLRGSTPYAEVVDRLRAGPPAWSPMAWPLLSGPLNTTEFAIHHEDVRRAQPGWTPRVLPRAAQDAVWSAAGLFSRRAAAGRRGGLVLRRSDAPGEEKSFGDAGTTVEGEPLELLLWAAGRRDVARVTVS